MDRETIAFVCGAIIGVGLTVGGFIVKWMSTFLGIEHIPDKPEEDSTKDNQ
jgi:hypothetical protein